MPFCAQWLGSWVWAREDLEFFLMTEIEPTIKAYRRMEVSLHEFLTSALLSGKRFVTHWILGTLVHRVDLGSLEKARNAFRIRTQIPRAF